MRFVEIDGHLYRSVREVCHKYDISYQKVKRLCRHFRRAAENPRVAIDWCTGKENFSPAHEPKTHKYSDDQKLATERQRVFIRRCQESLLKNF